MAIKGKRRRSRPRAPALPPRPAVGARRTPLPLRRDVKRAAVIALSVLAMLGGLRVWQNVSRADAVRAFNRQLLAAQRPLLVHLSPDSITGVATSIEAFQNQQMTAKQFLDLTSLWEKDFRAAKDAVEKLKPPNEVSRQAQELMVQGIDGYVGVARLWNVAGQLRQNAEAEKDPARKKAWNDKVEVILQHASEWRSRADAVYTVGQRMFDDLKDRYGVEPKIETGTTTP